MAKVSFGNLAADARKSIGGVTYSKNRYGAYVRSRTSPVQPRTAKQLQRREFLVQAAQSYRDLSDPQREGWHNLGLQMTRQDSLGQQYTLTGAQAYNAVNIARLTYSSPLVSTAPILESPDALSALTAVVNATGTPEVSVSGDGGTLGGKVLVYATGPHSAGKTFIVGFGADGRVKGGELKLLEARTLAASGSFSFDETAAYEALFGPLSDTQVGARVSFVLVPVSTNFFQGQAQRVDAIIS